VTSNFHQNLPRITPSGPEDRRALRSRSESLPLTSGNETTGLGAMREDEIGHFITKIKIRDTTYLYNDLARNGEAVELGPLYLLEEYDPNTTYVVYLRRSKACVRGLHLLTALYADFSPDHFQECG
jgi:hypothetical protein